MRAVSPESHANQPRVGLPRWSDLRIPKRRMPVASASCARSRVSTVLAAN